MSQAKMEKILQHYYPYNGEFEAAVTPEDEEDIAVQTASYSIVKRIWQGDPGVIEKLKGQDCEFYGNLYANLTRLHCRYFTALNVLGVYRPYYGPDAFVCDADCFTRTGRKKKRHSKFGCKHCLGDKLAVIAYAKKKMGLPIDPIDCRD
jgi:hypothetical protein